MRAAVAALAMLGLAMAGPAGATSPGVELRVLGLSGDAAPLGLGQLGGMGAPILNEAGDLVVELGLEWGVAGVDGYNSQALLLEHEGAWHLAARGGAAAAGTPPGVVFYRFRPPALTDDGRVVFAAILLDETPGVTFENDNGYWSYEPAGGASLLLREDQPSLIVDESGEPAAVSASGLTAAFVNHEVAAISGGVASPIAAVGAPAPGAPAGATFYYFYPYLVSGGSSGVVFPVLLDDWPYGFSPALFGPDGSGGVTLLAALGMQAPGVPAGAIFDHLDSFDLAENGAVAFPAALREGEGGVTLDDDMGIWATGANGEIELRVREGDLAPGAPAGARFDTLGGEPLIDEAGRVLFHAQLRDTDADHDEGLWLSDAAGAIVPLALEGDPLADGSGAVLSFWIGPAHVSSAGHVAFYAALRGPGVEPWNSGALVVVPEGGEPLVVLRTGESVEVAPGDFRVVYDISHLPAQPASSGTRTLTNAGRLGLGARFTDDTHASIVATVPVPEPAAPLQLAAAAGTLWLFRRSARASKGAPARHVPS